MKKPRSIKKIGRGGKRKTLGWTLLTLGLLVAGVWVASGWWCAFIGPLTLSNGMAYGRTGGREPSSTSRAIWEYGSNPVAYWDWWYGWRIPTPNQDVLKLGVYKQIGRPLTGGGVSTGHYLVLWPIPLLLCTPAALLLRSGILARRRANTNACPKCGYSLAGLSADAPCPECGKPKRQATDQHG